MKTDLALGIVMIVSLVALHVMNERAFLGGVLALPPVEP